ncbi:hypothetical protein PtA15_5A473 [Puccinia triticina]|uniref:Uncharacterized protein n=1 Tax=Puccinia triticina TaxID=208348 RepID=A0ABY7CJI8_9BASI|nr:uncharacterized protein PtA15_5A473 [Puccinia triticina]WAQ84900.1 hypothetical protein PtA15_5A473 [Puccinia triticina]
MEPSNPSCPTSPPPTHHQKKITPSALPTMAPTSNDALGEDLVWFQLEEIVLQHDQLVKNLDWNQKNFLLVAWSPPVANVNHSSIQQPVTLRDTSPSVADATQRLGSTGDSNIGSQLQFQRLCSSNELQLEELMGVLPEAC